MQLAFSLFKYFPFGGLQRDFLRIASDCRQRGHEVRVYTLSWQGEVPSGFNVIKVPVRAISNHARYEKFARWVSADLAAHPADRVIGFNKMPGLDVYYAADACYEEKARSGRHRLYRLSPRYKHFSRFERAVFDRQGRTRILMIAQKQIPIFREYYDTPLERFHLLPPGISTDRRAPPNAPEIRRGLREEFGLSDDQFLLAQIGSGFKTKGLDRTLHAVAALPSDLRARCRVIAIGQDDPAPFQQQARVLGLADQVTILPGRSDIPRFLLGADVLLHPAYNENTGTVLLEAAVAGLPVITTATCGYAHYLSESGAGEVLPEPFEQAQLNTCLAHMLSDATSRRRHGLAGLAFADNADIYSMPVRAAEFIVGPMP